MPQRPDSRAPTTLRRGSGRSPQSRSFWGKLAVFLLVPLALYTFYVVAEKSLQTYRLGQEAAIVRAEIEAEKRENLILQQELVAAHSDQQVEDSARRHLNLVKPGDNPIVLVSPHPPPTPTARPPTRPEPVDEPPAWLAWLLERLGR